MSDQPSHLVSVDWRARLSEHLGTYTCELLQPNAALLMSERLPLLALTAAAALVERLLPEREPHPDTFASLAALIATSTLFFKTVPIFDDAISSSRSSSPMAWISVALLPTAAPS